MPINKKILIGVTGSIAAYKTANLVRLLIKEGAEVKVVMTPSASDFITPLTLATLSKNPVLNTYFDPKSGSWHNHVELGLWADAFVVAPASANTLAKMAQGICDNLLLAVYLSARCKVFFAPAMDLDMIAHPATQNNIRLLKERGNIWIPSEEGELASGLTGDGRMAEAETIVNVLKEHFGAAAPLKGKKALVTAGPTYENLDPVRFIGNYSSGKMGFAIAAELASKGAEVLLVSGPTHLSLNHPSIKRINITSAQEMFDICTAEAPKMDIVIMSAAVADYKPENIASKKIKKKDITFLLKLTKTQDILKELGAKKPKGQVLAGFALETDNELKNAKAKLEDKNLDFIVLNSLNDEGAAFAGDNNKITIIDKKKGEQTFPLKPKQDVAKDIVDKVVQIIHA